MKRQDFLALIPMLGSVPFIGKELIQEKSKIILIEPKPIEIVKDMPARNDVRPTEWGDIGIQLTVRGHVVAHADLGYNWELRRDVAQGWIDDAQFDFYRDRETMLKVKATFRHNEVIRAINKIV